ncbi:sulfatase family protein [Flammeovirga aprica]|uniref:Sulfatase-like hydrolase/transferase n=1 Tax=Flammeovirga aprica JL-4 TaxID=694437 RepID=A0A7X9RYE5_9BACT|nr:sulfatase-like hydrolase/transferase [Flammeovirga aprica]NME71016.1 sulfatase-like hydrolase/transferase [Flammeovirga aprica JL-4]
MVLRLRFLALLLFGALSVTAQNKPNFLIIVADDLGYGDLTCYGAKDIQSPTIDKIANEGALFTNFHTTSSVCSPSRASMYTGKYPDLVGVPGVVRANPANSYGFFDPKATTIMDVMKANDYSTALIGKWHLGHEAPNLPNNRGFEFFHGWLVGMTDYYEHVRYNENWMRKNEEKIEPEGHCTDLFTDWTLDYLDTKKNDPFCLFLTYTAPHSPLQPPAEYYEKVKAREKGISDKRAKYVALVEHMDDQIARVIKKLEDNKQLDNTVIMFVSDNGGAENHGADNGVLSGQKGDLLEGGLRVPFIIRWGDKIKKGQVTDHYMSVTDFFPTMTSMAGINYEGDLSGIDQTKFLLKGEIEKADRTDIGVRRGNRSDCVDGTVFYSVQKNGWKYMQNSACQPFVFYDMKKDMKEQNPIPADKLPKKKKNFDKILKKHIIETGGVSWKNNLIE